jgi:hypothetical protein
VNNLRLSICEECEEATIWHIDKPLYPKELQGVSPHEDLPEDIIQDFNEARTILDLSPRGAAALARYCVEKLCTHLNGQKIGTLNTAIAKLVAEGLDERIQKKLDLVRITGNDLVHPGFLDDRDNRDMAAYLLQLINEIVEEAISRPKRLEETYNKIDPQKLHAIKSRDKNRN